MQTLLPKFILKEFTTR